MENLLDKTTDEDRKFTLEWYIASLEASLNPVSLDEETMKSYAGVYGPRTISFESGALYYQREDRPKYKMIPMAEDLFMFDEIDYFRIKIIKDDSGQVVEVRGLYDSGRVDVSPRST